MTHGQSVHTFIITTAHLSAKGGQKQAISTRSKGGHKANHAPTSKGGSNHNTAIIASSGNQAHDSIARLSQTSSSGANMSKMNSTKHYTNSSSFACTTSPQYSITSCRGRNHHTSNATQIHTTQACLQSTPTYYQ